MACEPTTARWRPYSLEPESPAGRATEHPPERKGVREAAQAILEAAAKSGVKETEPDGILIRAEADLAIILAENHEKLADLVGKSLPLDRVDAKIALLSVMVEAKDEFFKELTKECASKYLPWGGVAAATIFLLGFFVHALL